MISPIIEWSTKSNHSDFLLYPLIKKILSAPKVNEVDYEAVFLAKVKVLHCADGDTQ